MCFFPAVKVVEQEKEPRDVAVFVVGEGFEVGCF